MCSFRLKMSFRISSMISKGDSIRKSPSLLLIKSLSDQKENDRSMSWSHAQFFKSFIWLGESYYINYENEFLLL